MEPSEEERSPFPWACPGCGADIDAPDQLFEFRCFVLVPRAAYALVEVLCWTCGGVSDAAVWIVNTRDFAKQLDGQGGADGIVEPGQFVLLERYLGLVEESRRRWEGYRGVQMEGALPEVDHSLVDLDLSDDRAVAVPAQILAAAWGLRRAVNGHPDGLPPVMLRVDHFNCALSVDEMPCAPQPYALHLSVMNLLTPGRLTAAEGEFLLSLFFAPEERPFLWSEPGRVQPVTHFSLPSGPPRSRRLLVPANPAPMPNGASEREPTGCLALWTMTASTTITIPVQEGPPGMGQVRTASPAADMLHEPASFSAQKARSRNTSPP